MAKHIYNLKRQIDHTNDPKHPHFCVELLPPVVDLRPKCPPVFDQGELGSCTANAGVACRMMLTGPTTPMLSRLFQYYQERKIEGTIKQDSGAQMRDICVALQTVGVCEETFDPYITTKYTVKPTAVAVGNAGKYKIASFATFDGDTIDDIQQIKAYLAAAGLPVLIGMDVYSSCETISSNGIMVMPDTATEHLLGGHAVMIVGYDDTSNVLIVRNSWGESWGDHGYFYMPYAYVEQKIAYDTWTLSM